MSVARLNAGDDPTASLTPIAGDPENDLLLELGIPPGAGIVEVQTQVGPLNAVLEPIDAADPDGDQRLVLTIPAGADGAAGPRGPGVTDVSVTILNTDDPNAATATLTPISGDPEGDFRLDLELPQGPQAEPIQEDFNTVVNASWHLDEVFGEVEFLNAFANGGNATDASDALGLVVQFEKPVLTLSLHNRSAFIMARWRDERGLECDCRIPTRVLPIADAKANDRPVRWLVGDVEENTSFNLITEVSLNLGTTVDSAIAVQLTPEAGAGWNDFMQLVKGQEVRRLTITVVLKGDWIVSEDDKLALDGNNIWPGIPDRPSGNGTQGNDWISALHISI